MKPAHLQEHWVKRPFRPFRLRLSKGSTRDVLHPECLWVTEQRIGISSGVADPVHGVAKEAVLIDPGHIVAAEMLSAQTKK
jgi:hypothetical protein